MLVLSQNATIQAKDYSTSTTTKMARVVQQVYFLHQADKKGSQPHPWYAQPYNTITIIPSHDTHGFIKFCNTLSISKFFSPSWTKWWFWNFRLHDFGATVPLPNPFFAQYLWYSAQVSTQLHKNIYGSPFFFFFGLL